MKLAVIIAEYNPFHNGHAYHIARTRAAGATHVAVVMSGNFVQRGEPAFLQKRLRASVALEHGADLVLELPLPYAMATAERFAFGGVGIAHALGCADFLSFGSECGEIERMQAAADQLEDPALSAAMAEALSSGLPFAAARDAALRALGAADAADLLRSPNNALALAYLQQLRHLGSAITPLLIQRKGAAHDAAAPAGSFASASALRGMQHWQQMAPFLPDGALDRYLQGERIDPARLEGAVLARLRGMGEAEFTRLPDCSEGLEHRLYNAVRKAGSIQEILTLAKTKRYTHARLRRLLYSAYLGVEGDLCHRAPPYLRILGANTNGVEILSRLKETAALPFAASLAQLEGLGGDAAAFAALEARATDLYRACLPHPGPCGSDYTEGAVWLTGKK